MLCVYATDEFYEYNVTVILFCTRRSSEAASEQWLQSNEYAKPSRVVFSFARCLDEAGVSDAK